MTVQSSTSTVSSFESAASIWKSPAAQPAGRRTAVGIQVAHDAAGKAVAGAGRIDHIGGRISGHDKDAIIAQEHGAVPAPAPAAAEPLPEVTA